MKNGNTKGNLIQRLGLKFDIDDLLRCHGRFNNANMPEETRSLIYLPKSHYWTELLVKEYHEKLFHAGASRTLSQIRNLFWIPKGRTVVKSVLYK